MCKLYRSQSNFTDNCNLLWCSHNTKFSFIKKRYCFLNTPYRGQGSTLSFLGHLKSFCQRFWQQMSLRSVNIILGMFYLFFSDVSDECCVHLITLYVFYLIFRLQFLYLFTYYFIIKRISPQIPQRSMVAKRRTLHLWKQDYMQVEKGKIYRIITPLLTQFNPVLNITWDDVRSLQPPFIYTK